MYIEKNRTLFDQSEIIAKQPVERKLVSYNADDVKNLAEQILKHKRLYYAGSAAISDAEYDKLEDKLRKISPSHPVLDMVGSDVEGSASAKVEHSVPMLSLAKTYVEEEIGSWMGERPIVGTYKIDGNSLSLVYEDGKIALGKTRGNGRVGENVSEKISWVSDCVPNLGAGINYEIRGELYCSDTSFVHLADEMQARGLEKPTNPRNIVAGVLGRKSHLDLASHFNFYAFDVLDSEGDSPFESETEKYKWLEKNGFRVPPHKIIKTEKQINSFLEQAREYMEEGDVGIDGVVFAYDDVGMHRELGSTAHHPRFKLSFKWAGETAQATIDKITWATSRLGIVTPVAVIDPVYLSGANITNITLHNAAHVMAYNLKSGDVIEIIRSGEVIPKFLRVVEAKSGDYVLPKTCNSCGTNLERDDVRLTCPNTDECPSQRIGGIINWIKAAEIDDLSEKRLTAMIELDLVKTATDLYTLTVEDFLKLPLTKEKMAEKLYGNIQKSKDVSLANFLTGLGIQGTGRNTWELILEKYPTLKEVRKLTEEQIVEIKGFADKLAKQVVSKLKHKSSLIDDLLEVGVKPKDFEVKDVGDLLFSGMSFVITGTLSRARAEIQKDIKENGGSVVGSVSKNTSVLITNDADSGSSKAKKAKQLGIPIWSENELENKLK
jgi:DNA ligase (NAD+)